MRNWLLNFSDTGRCKLLVSFTHKLTRHTNSGQIVNNSPIKYYHKVTAVRCSELLFIFTNSCSSTETTVTQKQTVVYKTGTTVRIQELQLA
jgi:hypothetical protein